MSKYVPEILSEYMPERVSDRMSGRMPERMILQYMIPNGMSETMPA
jgi:hypothetical protein